MVCQKQSTEPVELAAFVLVILIWTEFVVEITPAAVTDTGIVEVSNVACMFKKIALLLLDWVAIDMLRYNIYKKSSNCMIWDIAYSRSNTNVFLNTYRNISRST